MATCQPRTAPGGRVTSSSGRRAARLALSSASCWLGLHVAHLVLERVEARVERRAREFGTEIGLGNRGLDVLADVLERLDVGVDRESVELLLNPQAGLRRLHLGQHRVALGLQLADLALHAEQRGLGAVGVGLRRVQFGPHLREVCRELVLLLDQHQREVVLAGLERGAELGLGLREVLGRLRHARGDVLTAPDDRGGRGLEPRVLLDHRVDRVLVRDLRMLLLDVRDPQREEAAPEVAETGEHAHVTVAPSLVPSRRSRVRPAGRWCRRSCRRWSPADRAAAATRAPRARPPPARRTRAPAAHPVSDRCRPG